MSQENITIENPHLISADLANHYRILPGRFTDNIQQIYVDESQDLHDMKEELEILLGKRITFQPLPTDETDRALAMYYRKNQTETTPLNMERGDFLEDLFVEAKSLKSSDIHFEIYEEIARIRFRIDGQLIERYKIEKDNYPELVNKVKIKAKLNITEKRLPQDGRVTNESFDIRVSVLPTLFGEKIVMRLLGQDASNIDLHSLGLQDSELKQYLEAIKKPNGIVLISGPTGSGKTTTLYATLQLLNDSKRNIVTVEDPIEYTLVGINQVQLKEDIGLTFTSALRSFLRQDPDIIMLGEIRDSDTALMAIRASLTGHLVLSTIHTNSATATISRLVDMGVPSYLIAETLNISVAQRLLRLLCKSCRKATSLKEDDFPAGYVFPFNIEQHYKPVGCATCYHTGYKGRTAIYEILTIDRTLSEAIKHNSLNGAVDKISDHHDLSYKAFELLARGETSLEEIYPILITE